MSFFENARLKLGKWITKGLTKSDFKRLMESDEIDTPISINNSYIKQIWVYAAVNAIAINLSRVPLRIYKGEKEVTSGLEYEIVHNPYGMTQNEMIEGMATWKHIRGDSFVVIHGEKNTAIGLELVSSDNVSALVQNGVLVGWRIRQNNGNIDLPLERVMQYKFFNPFDPIRGCNPLNPAYSGIEADSWARDFDRSLLKNGSAVGGVVEIDQNLDDAQYQRLLKAWDQRHKGANKAGKITILEGGMKYREIKLTAQDMNYIEQRKMNKAEILAAYKVPPVEVGDHENSNYSNAEAQMRQFWTKKLMPELRNIEALFNRVYFANYTNGLTCKFDISGIEELQSDFSKQMDSAVKLFSMGVPFNEINKRLKLGFEDIEGGEVGYLPFSLAPASSVAMKDETVTDVAPEKRISNIISMVKAMNEKKEAVKKEVENKNEKIWKKWDRDIRRIESKYRKEVEAFFFRMRKETLENYLSKDMKGVKSYFDTEKAKKKISSISDPYFTQAVVVGAEGIKDEVAPNLVYSLESPEVISFLRTKKSKITGIVDTVDSQVNQVIAQGVAEGKTTSEIADGIRAVFTSADKRALMIAQTEIVGASNFGRIDGMIQAGIEYKTWINSFDDKVRDAHQFTETQRIEFPFQNGLMYPGDVDGPPEEVINCRCTMGASMESNNENE